MITIKNKWKIASMLMLAVVLASCSSSEDTTDTEKPKITISFDAGFPKACAELQRGKTYTFIANASDNDALATYSIDVHNNFDHHTHGNQGSSCDFHADKQPVTPFLFMKNYSINEGGKQYQISQEIQIPANADVGDYHCQYTVTDKTGWSSNISIDFKIAE